MSIQEKINQELKQAMIGKDVLTVSVLRLVKSAIHNQVIAKKQEKLTDDEVLKVLQTEARKRNDSIDAYKKGNRLDLADKEEKELKIIGQFMPAQLTNDQIKKVVQEVVANFNETERNFGQVMKKVMAEIKGQADGKVVSQIVKEQLSR